MQQSNKRFLIPWLVGASDMRRYLGRACNQCLRGRVIFFFHRPKPASQWCRYRLLCLAPVGGLKLIPTALADFQNGRFYRVELSTLRRVNLGNLTMAVLKWRGDRTKPAIEEVSGPWITTTAAAKCMRCSVKWVQNQITRGAIVGYPALGDRRQWRIPLWQFANRGKLHSWVPELIRSYSANGWALIHFVCVPRRSLDGGHYLRLLHSGRVDAVIAAARRSNPD